VRNKSLEGVDGRMLSFARVDVVAIQIVCFRVQAIVAPRNTIRI